MSQQSSHTLGATVDRRKAIELHQWAESVVASEPQEATFSPAPSQTGRSHGSNASPLPSRPNSTKPVPEPTTVYISEEDRSSRASPEMITPRAPSRGLTIKSASGPSTKPHGVRGGDPTIGQLEAIEGEGQTLGGPSTSRSQPDDRYRAPRLGTIKGKWRRPDPHPMYSPRWASRRLSVRFPHAVRASSIKQFIDIHFARYGSLRGTFIADRNGDTCQKFVVVFHEEQAATACLSDPESRNFRFQSGPTVLPTKLIIKIDRLHPESTLQVVYIRMSGVRTEQHVRRSSPTSPARHEDSPNKDEPSFSSLPIPDSVIIYARPSWRRDQRRLSYWATVLERDMAMDEVLARTLHETGEEPFQLDVIDMKAGIEEDEIVPKLCWYLCDDHKALRPIYNGHGGWLIKVAGLNEGRRLLDEVGKIPGFIVRWAAAGDEPLELRGSGKASSSTAPPLTAPSAPPTMVTDQLELDPRVNVNMDTLTSQQVPARASTASKRVPAANVKSSSAQDRPSTKPRSVNDRRASSVHSQSTRKAQNKSRRGSVQPGPIGNPASHGHQFQHPFLTKSSLFTYKGRVLEQSMGQDGEVIYVDRAAVFVGRIAKGVETQNTLLQRFARYGKIVDVEYNPHNIDSTYATGRILYQSQESAELAIRHEDGQVSFGSILKVERRKVLALDVSYQEMYLDHLGRPVPPSMVEQYSPPTRASSGSSLPFPSLPPPPMPMPHNMHPSMAMGYHPPGLPQLGGPHIMPGVFFGYNPHLAGPMQQYMGPPNPSPLLAPVGMLPPALPIGQPAWFPPEGTPDMHWFGVCWVPPPPPLPVMSIPHHVRTNPSPPQTPERGDRLDLSGGIQLPMADPTGSIHGGVSLDQLSLGQHVPETPPPEQVEMVEVADHPALEMVGGPVKPVQSKFENGLMRFTYTREDLEKYRKETGADFSLDDKDGSAAWHVVQDEEDASPSKVPTDPTVITYASIAPPSRHRSSPAVVPAVESGVAPSEELVVEVGKVEEERSEAAPPPLDGPLVHPSPAPSQPKLIGLPIPFSPPAGSVNATPPRSRDGPSQAPPRPRQDRPHQPWSRHQPETDSNGSRRFEWWNERPQRRKAEPYFADSGFQLQDRHSSQRDGQRFHFGSVGPSPALPARSRGGPGGGRPRGGEEATEWQEEEGEQGEW